jgi:hypothetical protein
MASDSERSRRMVIYLINTVRHSETESSDRNLQILYGCWEEWCPHVWKPAMPLALGRWSIGYTRKRPRGQACQGVGADCSIKRQPWYSSTQSLTHPPDPMSSQRYVKTCQITETTKNVSNSFDQEPLEPSVSPAYPAISPPSFPCRPGSSILIDCHFERSLTETQAYRWNGKEATKEYRCTYCICFAQ